MAKIWQLPSLEQKLNKPDAAHNERLYERFRFERDDLFNVTIEGKGCVAANLSFGGLGFTTPDAQFKRDLGGMIQGKLEIWGKSCSFRARVANIRPLKTGTFVAAEFTYDSIELLEFLRQYLATTRLGFYLATELVQMIDGAISVKLDGLTRTDFDAELVVDRSAEGLYGSAVFSFGNAQIALILHRKGGIATYKNIGTGGEMVEFVATPTPDLEIVRKAMLLLTGFLSQEEGEADVRMFQEELGRAIHALENSSIRSIAG